LKPKTKIKWAQLVCIIKNKIKWDGLFGAPPPLPNKIVPLKFKHNHLKKMVGNP
jgi:hypothetical protein